MVGRGCSFPDVRLEAPVLTFLTGIGAMKRGAACGVMAVWPLGLWRPHASLARIFCSSHKSHYQKPGTKKKENGKGHHNTQGS